MKHDDCDTKHCAQVGPRRYDKECQESNFIEFAPVMESKKRGPHTRDKDDSKREKKEVKESEEPKENAFDLRKMAFFFNN